MDPRLEAFKRLLDIMDELREKCPWDKEQTNESLRHLTIEETYELSDAILKDDADELKKELGDLMLHMVFYARIASKKGSSLSRMCSIQNVRSSSDVILIYTAKPK